MFKRLNTFIPWAAKQGIKQIEIIGANKSFIYSKTNRYVDMTSGLMVVNLGHNNKYIKHAFSNQLDTGLSYVPSSFGNYHRDKLSTRLLDVTQKKGKVFYGLGGADVNETAIFLSLEYHRINGNNRSTVLTFEKSFHGGSSIVSSLIGGDSRKINKEQYFELPLSRKIPNPTMEDDGDHSISTIKDIIKDGNVAGIMIEGSSGSAGCIHYPKGYLDKIQKICTDNDVILILDEVMSGWGRTGKLFGYNHSNINPDIITMAKGLTCGYSPLGALVVDNKISDMYDTNRLNTGLTYYGHPISCSVANNCLDLYLDDNMKIIDDANDLGIRVNKVCKHLMDKYTIITEFRTNGLLGCFEFKNDLILQIVTQLFLDNGIFCYNKYNLLFIAPPLNIDIDLLFGTFRKMDLIFEEIESKIELQLINC